MSNLPKGWTWSSLGDHLAPGKRGLNPSTHPTERFELYSIPAYEAAQAENRLGSEIGSSKNLVSPGDVLLSKIVPHIRRSWVVPPAGQLRQIASSEWITFRSEAVHSKYLRHFLTSDVFHSQFMKTVAGVGGSLLRAQPKAVARILFPLPPLDEQRRIATILDKANNSLAAGQRASSHTTRLIKSTASTVEQDPALNRATLEELGVNFIAGRSVTGSDADRHPSHRVIKTSAVSYGHFDSAESKPLPRDYEPADTHRLSAGDLLFTRASGSIEMIGVTTFVPEVGPNLFLPDKVWRVDLGNSPSIRGEYLHIMLRSRRFRAFVENEASGASGVRNISKRKVLRYSIPVLEARHQHQIASMYQRFTVLEDMRTERNNILQSMNTTLQRRAFRGEL